MQECPKKKKKKKKKINWLDVITGFTTIIDVTVENILRLNPRYLTLSKNFDSFFSFGPQIITPDEFDAIQEIQVATVINGTIHANNIITNTQFPLDYLVSFHSQIITLLPGDIISTGTPRAAPLNHGDVIECRISRFLPLKNSVIDLKINSTLKFNTAP
ncbi:MAG: fumarylacetoacetate hydrolase family protein [Promethearchaeota archaeon]